MATPETLRGLLEVGIQALQNNQLQIAKARFESVLETHADCADAWHLLGLTEGRLGDFDKGITHVQQAIKLLPDQIGFCGNCLYLMNAAKKYQAALAFASTLSDKQKKSAVVLNHLGNTHMGIADFKYAESLYSQALTLDQSNVEIATNLAESFRKNNKLDDANRLLNQVLSADANFLNANIAKISLLRAEGRFAEGVAYARRFVETYPNNIELLKALSGCLDDLGKFSEAEQVFSKLLALNPGDNDSRFQLSIIRLRCGDFARGWADYGFRYADGAQHAGLKPHLPQATWDGSELGHGQRILVWADQGIGDQIMFGQLIAEFTATGASVIVWADGRLRELILRFDSSVEWLDQDWNDTSVLARVECDYQICLSDAARYLRPTKDSFKPLASFLRADSDKVNELRSDYQRRFDGFRVGIAWHSANKRLAARKNLKLSDYALLAAQDGVQLFNLQYGNHGDEIAAFERETGKTLFDETRVDRFNDIDGLAAQILAMDLVITTSNIAVHLAGSLGVPTWLLLSGSPDWRWQDSGDESIWYPSVKLWRPEPGESPKNLMVRIAGAMRELLAEQSGNLKI